MKEKKQKSKHEISTVVLFFFIFVLMTGAVLATLGSGIDGSIQFNDAGTINGSSNFTYNKTTGDFNFEYPHNAKIKLFEYQPFAGYFIPMFNGTNHLGTTALSAFDTIFIFSETNQPRVVLLQLNTSESATIQLDTDGTLDFSLGGKFPQYVPTYVGYLTTGSNGAGGLVNGEINTTNLYYDTLVAKSPIFLCSQGSNKCFVIDLEIEKEFYITFDNDYNVLEVKNKETKKTDVLTDKITKKIEKRKCEKDGFSVIVNETCLENPIAKCRQTTDSTFNLNTNTCEYNAEKDCQNNNNAWFEGICYEKPAKELTTEQLQNECVKNNQMIWFNGACITLEVYYQ